MKKKAKSNLKWYDLDESLRNFITVIAREFSIKEEYVKVLIDLIHKYGCKCFIDGFGRE
jgi:hypothetical protein